MSITELLTCTLTKCVPMTEAEYQALLKRAKRNVGGRRTLHLHPNNRKQRCPAQHAYDDGK